MENRVYFPYFKMWQARRRQRKEKVNKMLNID